MSKKITVKIELDEEVVIGCLLNGLETTSWCRVPNYHFERVKDRYQRGLDISCQDAYDEENPCYINRSKVEGGLKLMAEEHPRHFKDLISDNFDAITSDVFLQLAIFGELVYG